MHLPRLARIGARLRARSSFASRFRLRFREATRGSPLAPRGANRKRHRWCTRTSQGRVVTRRERGSCSKLPADSSCFPAHFWLYSWLAPPILRLSNAPCRKRSSRTSRSERASGRYQARPGRQMRLKRAPHSPRQRRCSQSTQPRRSLLVRPSLTRRLPPLVLPDAACSCRFMSHSSRCRVSTCTPRSTPFIVAPPKPTR